MPVQSSILLAVLQLCFRSVNTAAEWSGAALSRRNGKRLCAPFHPLDFHTNIWALSHAGGCRYGIDDRRVGPPGRPAPPRHHIRRHWHREIHPRTALTNVN
jgi:hypothetical protein